MSRFTALRVAQRLAEATRAQRGQTFLTPLTRDGWARLRVEGLIFDVRVNGATPGWWICQLGAARSATIVEEAQPWQRGEYLRRWPTVRLVLVEPRRDGAWIAVPYNQSDADQRFRLPTPLILWHVVDGQPFDRVIGRVDGATIWYDEPDRRGDSALAEKLRTQAKADQPSLHLRGMSDGEQLAFALLRQHTAAIVTAEAAGNDWGRASTALAIGGAQLIAVERLAIGMRVTWERDGQRQVTLVDDTLTVVSAGICLGDRDEDFDLASIVDVMRVVPEE